MGRKKQKSLAEDFVSAVGALPWWAGIGLAPIIYLVLHRFAQPPVATEAARAGSQALQIMVATGAGILQYVLPLLCLIAAAISAWRRRNRKQLADSVASSQSAAVVDEMTWQQFEHLVSEAFRRQGFSVKELGAASPDGGVDLELRRGTELHLVQCKHWKALSVGISVVRELFGVVAARGAAGGYVVTSGRFTDDAKAFATGRNLQLIDGARLQAMLSSSQPTLPAAPPCPKCGAGTVLRVASRGSRQGQEFWGCTSFPSCRGTLPR